MEDKKFKEKVDFLGEWLKTKELTEKLPYFYEQHYLEHEFDKAFISGDSYRIDRCGHAMLDHASPYVDRHPITKEAIDKAFSKVDIPIKVRVRTGCRFVWVNSYRRETVVDWSAVRRAINNMWFEMNALISFVHKEVV